MLATGAELVGNAVFSVVEVGEAVVGEAVVGEAVAVVPGAVVVGMSKQWRKMSAQQSPRSRQKGSHQHDSSSDKSASQRFWHDLAGSTVVVGDGGSVVDTAGAVVAGAVVDTGSWAAHAGS